MKPSCSSIPFSILRWGGSSGSSVIAKVGTAATVEIGAGILVVGEDSRMVDEEMGIVEDYIVTQEARCGGSCGAG